MPEHKMLPADRCDRCGAQAYTRWVRALSVLLFCAHHANLNDLALMLDGWELRDDERSRLDEPSRTMGAL